MRTYHFLGHRRPTKAPQVKRIRNFLPSRLIANVSTLFCSNWDWNMVNGHRGQQWLVLFCGDGYSGCQHAMHEWERAHETVGPYIRMGRVNVDHQRALTHNFNVRYVPAVYVVEDGGREISRFGGAITADSLTYYVRSSIPNEFSEIRTIDGWNIAFDWESKLRAGGLDASEKVQVVLLTNDPYIPLKWRYWGQKYSKTMNFFVVSPRSASRDLLTMLNTNYGVARSGVAILFPNPRDNTDVVLLGDDSGDGEDGVLTSEEVSAWLKGNQFPRLVKLDASNFLNAIGSLHYTILMAVDMSIGGTGSESSSRQSGGSSRSGSKSSDSSPSGSQFAQSSAFGSSRLKRMTKMIEPLTTLWEQRRGTNERDLQFAWFGVQNQAILKALGLEKVQDGQLVLIDRRTWEFALLTLDIDRDEVSTFINLLLKYSQRKLSLRPLAHIPQVTDGEWSLGGAISAASNWGYVAIGVGLVFLFGASMIVAGGKENTNKNKKEDAKKKTSTSSKTSASSESAQSSSSSQKASSTDEKSDQKPKPTSSSSSTASSSSSSSVPPGLFNIELEQWLELNGLNYDSILRKRHFTVVLFPRLDRPTQAKQWQGEVEIASDALATDSVTFAWADIHKQPRYVKYWTEWCDRYLRETAESDEKLSAFGILLRKRGDRYMIISGKADGVRKLNATSLISWVQRVLEGQTAWMDIPEGAPTPT